MKVLIADDDPSSRLLLAGLLKNKDCEILLADNGTTAMEILQGNALPNLIFMDWNMPGMTGVEIISLLRTTQQEYQPYIIMISANDGQEQIIEALDYGADDYITKPMDGHLVNAKYSVAKRIIDIQEKLKQSNEMLEKLAYYDELTGVLNRRAGNASFEVELERCIRKDQNICIAMVDIDHFKSINDNFGHQVGDKVLREAAGILKKTLRPYDVVCRYGGEEFMLIAEISIAAEAEQLLERVRKKIADSPIQVDNEQIHITASFGALVRTPKSHLQMSDLVKQADTALYEAKGAGRNQVIIIDELSSAGLSERSL